MTYYVHNLNPVAFEIFGVSFPWYWLVYFAGYFFILSTFEHLKKIKLTNISQVDFHNYLFGGFFSMLIGAKIFFILFYYPSYYIASPARIFKIWEGGMSFHGALIGAWLWSLYFSKRRQLSMWALTDVVATGIALVLFFGRIANFINGELAGKQTTVFWAVIFPRYGDGLARHPSQLYQALLEGLLLFALLWGQKKFLLDLGRQSIRFLFFYGLFRFIAEFYREADLQVGTVLNLNIGQIYCLAMMGIAFILFARK